MDAIDFHDYIIVPTLDQIGLNQPGASFLLLGTALVESDLSYVRQQGDGPALGLFQMEPNTHDDLWLWLTEYSRNKELRWDITRLSSQWPAGSAQLVMNNAYATAMARCLYRRRPEPLPYPARNIEAHALYWKKHYNTFQSGQTHEYVRTQLERFVSRFPKSLLERREQGEQ